MSALQGKMASIWALACLMGVLAARPEAARSEEPAPTLAVADAKDYLGDWTLSVDMQGNKREMRLKVFDEKGKAVATLGSPRRPEPQRITDISKEGAGLKLKYEANFGGNAVALAIVIKRDGDKLSGTFGDEGGQFSGPLTGAKADPNAPPAAPATAATDGDGAATDGDGADDGSGRRRRGGGGGGGGRGGFMSRGQTRVTLAGKPVEITFGKPTTSGPSYKDFPATKDGAVVRIIEGLPPKLRTEVNLRFGDKVIKTGNISPDYPGVYALFLKKVGEGWHLVFNNQADTWGTQHEPEADFAEIPLTYAKAASEAQDLTVELKAEGDAGTLRIAWGPHEWTAKFSAEKNG